MKQLLIVKSGTQLNGGATDAKDLSPMPFGAIGFFSLDDYSWLSAKPTCDFGIALGRGSNSPAFVIPEVDIHTLRVNVAEPDAGTAFHAEITVPTVEEGSTYTIVLVKKAAVPHERNTWTATETVFVGDTTTDAAGIATKLAAYFQRMADTGSLNVSAVASGSKVTITGLNVGEQFTVKLADDLAGATKTLVEATPAIGDKKYIQHLASECAAGKGFTDTYQNGDSIYPGYPEEVEDLKYKVYTLRFAVGRKSAKTRDERVSQLVHIAVPSASGIVTTLDSIVSSFMRVAAAEEPVAGDDPQNP